MKDASGERSLHIPANGSKVQVSDRIDVSSHHAVRNVPVVTRAGTPNRYYVCMVPVWYTCDLMYDIIRRIYSRRKSYHMIKCMI